MYVIKNKKNEMYYRLKIDKNTLHLVFDIKEAKKIVSMITARDILNSFNKPENYEIIKIKGGKKWKKKK